MTLIDSTENVTHLTCFARDDLKPQNKECINNMQITMQYAEKEDITSEIPKVSVIQQHPFLKPNLSKWKRTL